MIISARNTVKFGMRTVPTGKEMPELPSRPPLPLFNTNTNAVDCIRARATVR